MYEIEQAAEKIKLHHIKSSVHRELSRIKRDIKGLKPNRATYGDLIKVLEFWFDRDFKNVAKIFRDVYDVVDKTNKEYDWATAMPLSAGYINQFKNAVNLSTHPKVVQVRDSKYFDMDKVTAKGLTFSGRMRVMKEMYEIEEEFLALQQEALDAKQDADRWKDKVRHILGWEIEAEDMLVDGKKQVEVCIRFNKSASTVKRLVKRLKEEGVL
ncbi:hypothetical protein S14_195 [Shewanella sp. phage 1/4]|uniref:hypothetical protein n=1 Tax=Shewanella phage 1/4 TaxID=1458859 RepID=UPI0004F72269|nr:hypothetical protein S14_195 [Shewanella sp. phage 1/4]AHK11304.1 hypothetical protein S14_195 [Shewanella sp. phage 1/4]